MGVYPAFCASVATHTGLVVVDVVVVGVVVGVVARLLMWVFILPNVFVV